MARFFRSFPITQSRFAIPFGIRFPAVVVSAELNAGAAGAKLTAAPTATTVTVSTFNTNTGVDTDWNWDFVAVVA